MRKRLGRGVIAAACFVWLAGCQTMPTPEQSALSLAEAPNPPAPAAADSMASVPPPLVGSPPATPQLLGADPSDDLNIGKKYFRQGSYGLAERHFRRAVELHPRDAESWIGLAAAYDQLKRFDLADRAYAQVIKIVGPTPEVMNNQGFSYMLRGDYRRARSMLIAAQAKDPKSPFIANNLRLLDESARKAKAIN